MNSNAIRTVLAIVVAVLPFIVQFLGCTSTATGYDCSASWIPEAYLPYVMSGMTILALIIKTFGGTGSPVQNAVAPAVPVVAPSEAKVGVVTPAQVASPGSSKA